MLTEFVRTLNHGDSAGMRAFIAAHFVTSSATPPLADRVARVLGMHDRLGTLSVTGITSADSSTVRVALQTASAEHVTLQFDIEGSEPHRIRQLEVLRQ